MKSPSAIYDYSNFKDDKIPAGANILARLGGIARDQLHAEARVEQLTKELQAAKEALRHISENVMPTIMDEAGQADNISVDGIKITIRTAIRGSIPKRNEVKAFTWLEKHGHARIIKRQFVIDFGKDDDRWANKFERDLAQRKRPLNTKRKKTVHPNTLQAFVKGQLEEGTAIPMDTFGVFRQRFATVVVK